MEQRFVWKSVCETASKYSLFVFSFVPLNLYTILLCFFVSVQNIVEDIVQKTSVWSVSTQEHLRAELQSRPIRGQMPSPENLYGATEESPKETRRHRSHCSLPPMIPQSSAVRDIGWLIRKRRVIIWAGGLSLRREGSSSSPLPSRAAPPWTSCGRGSMLSCGWRRQEPPDTERYFCWRSDCLFRQQVMSLQRRGRNTLQTWRRVKGPAVHLLCEHDYIPHYDKYNHRTIFSLKIQKQEISFMRNQLEGSTLFFYSPKWASFEPH